MNGMKIKGVNSVLIVFFICLIFAGISNSTKAQVVINEFSTANYTDWNLAGENEDWVEFYNSGAVAFNIGGYWLSDNIINPQKWSFPATASIPAGGYLIVLLSGTGDFDPNFLGYLNTNFKVTQTAAEEIVFSNTAGTILETYNFNALEPLQANHSYGRATNGGPDWQIFPDPTQGANNTGTNFASYAQKPILSIQAGYQVGPISVNLTAGVGETIYYTLNGSEPTNGSTLYSGSVNINTTSTLRAIAYSGDAMVFRSKIETNTYFFGADIHSIPFVAVSGSEIGDGSWFDDELAHIEFFNPNGTFLTEATGDSNEHGNDSNAYGQRGFDYITRDALGYDNEVEANLFHHSNRDGYERLIFKAAANDNYPFSGGAHVRDAYVHELSILGDLHLDERKTEFCVVYLNGNYWGVYDYREKVDDLDYTDHYYDQPEGFVDFIKTWGGTWDEYGSSADWNTLVNFITSNDMTDAANYDYVLTQYNTMSLIDYFIMNGYTVCTDWLNWNTAWWRGRYPQGDAKRWRYALWDNDATFGHYVNYTGVPSTNPTADPCQIENMGDVGGQGHVPVLNALFDNEDFTADYVQRYATLSNTIFSCEQMIHVLDSMIAVIDPEMARQTTRWGGTYNGWLSSVQQLRDFINDRCSDEIIGGIEDCYDVTAFNVTIEIEGIGEVEMSDLDFTPATTPWTGIYFADLPIDISTIDIGVGCGTFEGWEIVVGTGTIADPLSDTTTFTIQSDVTIRAIFSEPTSGPIILTTDVFPSNSGMITANGIAQTGYPNETAVNAGSPLTLTATPNEWYIFEQWESIHSALDPDENATTITLNACNADTVVAVFEWIPNYELTLMLGAEGGGTILFNGSPIDGDLPWTTNLEAAPLYSFTAIPEDEWSTFSYWMINGSIITLDPTDLSIFLQLTQDDTLVAVFDVTPHFTITVQVDPAYSGSVEFAGGYLSFAEQTVELEANVLHEFTAFPEPYWEFKEWTSLNTTPVTSASPSEVQYKFLQSDTIVARFSKEDFTMFIPNSFTPNNDGNNDVFLPRGMAIDPESYHLYIFNRWGEKVFESTDMNKPWEGDHLGGEYYVPEEVFQYVLKVKSVHESASRDYSGSIYVIR